MIVALFCKRREKRDGLVFLWAEIESAGRITVSVYENVKTRVDTVFDQGVEFPGTFQFGQLRHYEILLDRGHVFTCQIEGAS